MWLCGLQEEEAKSDSRVQSPESLNNPTRKGPRPAAGDKQARGPPPLPFSLPSLLLSLLFLPFSLPGTQLVVALGP